MAGDNEDSIKEFHSNSAICCNNVWETRNGRHVTSIWNLILVQMFEFPWRTSQFFLNYTYLQIYRQIVQKMYETYILMTQTTAGLEIEFSVFDQQFT